MVDRRGLPDLKNPVERSTFRSIATVYPIGQVPAVDLKIDRSTTCEAHRRIASRPIGKVLAVDHKGRPLQY